MTDKLLTNKDSENIILFRNLFLNINDIDILDLELSLHNNHELQDHIEDFQRFKYNKILNFEEYLASYEKYKHLRFLLDESIIGFTLLPIGTIGILISILAILLSSNNNAEHIGTLYMLIFFGCITVVIGFVQLVIRKKILNNFVKYIIRPDINSISKWITPLSKFFGRVFFFNIDENIILN